MSNLDLSPEHMAQIDRLEIESHQALLTGQLREAEARLIECWNLIPEQKADFHFAQVAALNLVHFYRTTAQSPKALEWALQLKSLYAPGSAAGDLICGQSQYDVGDFDAAFVHFERVYAQMKTRLFKSVDPKYLDFYMTRSGKKKQR